MGNMKTPGVYILEKNAFPNSVVEVATAVPAFIGYTEKADNKGTSLHNRPFRITSLGEFHQYFGDGPTAGHVRFSLSDLKPELPKSEEQLAAEAKEATRVAALTPDQRKTEEEAAKKKAAEDAAKADDEEKKRRAALTDEARKAEDEARKAEDAAVAAKALDDALNAPFGKRDAEPLRLNKKAYKLAQTHGWYLLYQAMRWFFLNNGGPCYVVSVGTYETAADGTSPVEGKKINGKLLQDALKELEKELEPTMIVVPEAVLLNKQGCDAVQQQMLAHCGDTMKNRVAILDVWEGYLPRNEPPFNNLIELARTGFGSSFLAYGAAYYPWVHTSVLQERDLSFLNIHPDSRATLVKCITDELNQMEMPKDKRNAQITEVNKITTATAGEAGPLAASLVTISPFYNTVLREMAKRLNLLPPSAAMAGVYTMVDNTRGVWKAPANVSLNSAVAPAVPISHEQQEDLNVTPQGRSINAIRSFIGEGTLVWGARTLDGNSLDWRYVNVRRTMIMLEESVRLAAKALVFEPNVASTWVTMKGMIANFLTGIWKRGGLAGAVPEDAFSVHVGLGETMTPEDILEGILRVTVLVAISRPAEFIEITFQQQMQKS